MNFLQKIYLAAIAGGILLFSLSAAQAQNSAPTAEANAGYADGIVATVGKRKITRRDVIVTFAAYEPGILGQAILSRYPSLDSVMTLDMDSLCRSAFTADTSRLSNAVEQLLIQNALEEAAANRNIALSEESVTARTHRELEKRRKGLQLPEGSDEEVARRLGDNFPALRRAARESLLKERLTLADWEDRLGHPQSVDDFYSLHAIFTRVNDAKGVCDLKATLEKIRRQKADILAKKRDFEEVAKTESQDASRARGGSFGPLPRKLLKNEVDAALARLKPGEITEPIAILEGCAIFRLDKRGRDLTDAERKTALAIYLSSEKRQQEAIALALKDIPWTTTIGKTPDWMKQTDIGKN